MILYLFAGGYKCRLATFPTRFAHVISILRYCHCFALLKVLCHEQMNKYHWDVQPPGAEPRWGPGGEAPEAEEKSAK